jgi:hypothetical protein
VCQVSSAAAAALSLLCAKRIQAMRHCQPLPTLGAAGEPEPSQQALADTAALPAWQHAAMFACATGLACLLLIVHCYIAPLLPFEVTCGMLRCAAPCCRLCNRVRARLPDDDKANLDKVLAQLAPLFELGSEHPAEAAGASGPGQPPAEPAALARGHAVIADLAAAGGH